MLKVAELFQKKVDNLISRVQPNTLIFLKGFTPKQVCYLIGHSHSLLNAPELMQDGFLNLENLDNR